MGINSVGSASASTCVGSADHHGSTDSRSPSPSPSPYGIAMVRMSGGVYAIEQSGGEDESSNCCGGCLHWLRRLWRAVRSFFTQLHCCRESAPDNLRLIPDADVHHRPSASFNPPRARSRPKIRGVFQRQSTRRPPRPSAQAVFAISSSENASGSTAPPSLPPALLDWPWLSTSPSPSPSPPPSPKPLRYKPIGSDGT